MSGHDSGKIDPKQFRTVMGRFATGVCVVTAQHNGEVRGATINSFTSVSLDPPLILISLDNRARILPMLRASGRYAVSMLGEEQEEVSTHFAGKPREGIGVQFTEVDGLPLLEPALAHITATVYSEVPAGDHVLFLGSIDSLAELGDDLPLLFYSGRYGRLAESSAEAPIGPYSDTALTQFLDEWDLFPW